VEVHPIRVGDAGEFERAITAFAHSSNGGLIVGAGTVGLGALRDGIIKLAAPTGSANVARIFANRTYSTETGLRGWACEIRTQKCRRKLSL
jgi:hypothetical protein